MTTNHRIILIQLWIGKIPDYFWYHYETTKNIGLDFLFVTDQEINLDSKNYKILKIDKDSLERLVSEKLQFNYKILSLRNVCILKSALGDLFSEHIEGYDFYGHYDIDTLFGNIRKYVNPFLDSYDVISFAEKNYHDRISGPFTIFKNNSKNHLIYKNRFDEFRDNLINYDLAAFDEHQLNELHKEHSKIKLIYNSSNFDESSGKLIYDAKWYGGKVYVNSQEKLLHHFYNKNLTKFHKIGNSIECSYKKQYAEEFYWITYFTESYEKLIEGLIDSIKKFSNRKCILYTINYSSDLVYKLDEQFIFRRLDIPKGDFDKNGRDISVLSSKPLILSDAVEYMPDTRFIYIDTDVYLTNVADNLNTYFSELENYPLMNSHVHDRLYANDINSTNEWVSTIDIVSEATNIPVTIFPRRKCNLMLFDHNSKWFFEEQMGVYNQYKNSRPGIFRLHDEDTANILLSKYNFKKSLPLIDMEESPYINMDKIKNYSYNLSLISECVKLPKSENEIFIFHGFKDSNFYKQIIENYCKTILTQDDFNVEYNNNTILFKKNSFIQDKSLEKLVDFILKDENNQEILRLSNQKIFQYWIFYITNVILDKKTYFVEIVETNKKRIIYKNILNI